MPQLDVYSFLEIATGICAIYFISYNIFEQSYAELLCSLLLAENLRRLITFRKVARAVVLNRQLCLAP